MSLAELLSVEPLPSQREYQLTRDFHAPTSAFDVWVPEGFVYDGASIPRAAWFPLNIAPFDPRVMAAAAAHDWLYHTHAVTRPVADRILRELLRRNGIDLAIAQVIYVAVRAFGGRHWPNNQTDLDWMRELRERRRDVADIAKFAFPL